MVGAGVAGCAAAVAAAEAGAAVTLCEASGELGGVAAAAGHRWICGLAPIDSPRPELLEPAFVEPWLRALHSAAPQRRGRVWLWPSSGLRWRKALLHRLTAASVALQLHSRLYALSHVGDQWRCQFTTPTGMSTRCARHLIDATGGAELTHLLGLPTRPASQWAALRLSVRLDPAQVASASARLRLLRALAHQLGPCHAAFEPLAAADHWQLTLDVTPDLDPDQVRELGVLAARLVRGELLAEPLLAQRDRGAAAGGLDLTSLFAMSTRGVCWAAWPMELHGPGGITWRWPEGERHGVPEEAVRVPAAPPGLWTVGNAAPLAVEAAAALRVTGTLLALGGAVGQLAAS